MLEVEKGGKPTARAAARKQNKIGDQIEKKKTPMGYRRDGLQIIERKEHKRKKGRTRMERNMTLQLLATLYMNVQSK